MKGAQSQFSSPRAVLEAFVGSFSYVRAGGYSDSPDRVVEGEDCARKARAPIARLECLKTVSRKFHQTRMKNGICNSGRAL